MAFRAIDLVMPYKPGGHWIGEVYGCDNADRFIASYLC